jgi:hypothetical protein
MGTGRSVDASRAFRPRRSWRSPESVHCLPETGRVSRSVSVPQPFSGRWQSDSRSPTASAGRSPA